jgi:hypothetical protein
LQARGHRFDPGTLHLATCPQGAWFWSLRRLAKDAWRPLGAPWAQAGSIEIAARRLDRGHHRGCRRESRVVEEVRVVVEGGDGGRVAIAAVT